jgi:acyl-coenzyme A synthetase/AMP-(fatty) acid ligase
MPQHNPPSLLGLIAPDKAPAERFLSDAYTRVAIRDLANGTNLGASLSAFSGRSVMIATDRQLPTVLALVALDGIARRILLCTRDLAAGYVAPIMADAEIDTVVSDGTGPVVGVAHDARIFRCDDEINASGDQADRTVETEWVLLTSGTTGRPKLALHTLASLTGPISDSLAAAKAPIWSTFYDVRRYGGLQILLRAFGGGGSMVLSNADEPADSFLSRAGGCNVTHISGTPSHWRRALISAGAKRMAPGYVRLSGEVCDQAILDKLRQVYPHANIAHAFASTEAGVAFDVRDEQAGFPAELIGNDNGGVCMRIEDGSLRIRSTRTASRYLGHQGRTLADAAGFIDTGDLVELRDGRYYFIGRREGIINVGGLKVHPEAVETVINTHPAVQISRVSGRPSPITGAIVVAEIVLRESASAGGARFKTVRNEILDLCRDSLAPHEVPTIMREVPSLDIADSGKLVRRRA